MKLTLITPSKARAALRSLARGREPKIAVSSLAEYLLLVGVLEDPDGTQDDDFVQFAKRLLALTDPRD